jgi:DNA modification methylase
LVDRKQLFTPVKKMQTNILQGDTLKILKTLKNESIDCCVTSPPYYGLRDYLKGLWS